MEFTISRGELLAGLYLTQGIVERRATIAILSNVLIESEGDGVAVAATDQEVAVRRQCAAAVKRKGRITTGARRLYEMVREFPEGGVHIRSLENHWVEVSAGRSRFRLAGLDPGEFPEMLAPGGGESSGVVRVSGEMLAGMIESTVFAVSVDETRVNLNGIYVECVEPGRVRMVATDGHRLAMVTRLIEGAELGKGVIIPRKGIMELRKVLEADGEAIQLTVQSGLVYVERGAVRMSVRLIEGEFPDYQQVVPAKLDRRAVIETASLLAALRRVSIVSSERTRGVKLQIDSQRLELSSINPDVGEGVEEVEIEYEGDSVGIGFNARYLMDVLGMLPDDSRVELALNDEASPGMIQAVGDADYCYIVMPMRL